MKEILRKYWKFIGVVVGIVIAICICVGIYGSSANRLQRQLNLGQKYLDELNYEEAIIIFDQVIGINPLNVEAYRGKSEALLGMGDIECCGCATDRIQFDKRQEVRNRN